MSSLFELQVSERDNTLNPRQLREAGFLPATVYGKGHPTHTIQLRTYDFERALAHGNNTFKLAGPGLDGANVKIQALQSEAIGSKKMLNVEFLFLEAAKGTAAKKAPAKKTANKKADAPEAALASA